MFERFLTFSIFLLCVGLPCGIAVARASEEAAEDKSEVIHIPARESDKITVYGKKPLSPAPKENAEIKAEVLAPASPWSHSLGQYLSQSSSIEVHDTGGEGSIPSLFIRGQDPKQARYFLEGIPLTDAEFNGGNLSFLPAYLISQADIYPDGVPVYLAEDGLGGAVDFQLEPVDKGKSSIGTRFGAYSLVGAQGKVALEAPLSTKINVDYLQANEDYVYYDDNGTPFNSADDRLSVRKNNFFRRASFFPRIALYTTRKHDVQLLSLNGYGETQVPGLVSFPVQANLQEFFQLTAIKYEGKWAEAIRGHVIIFTRLDLQNLKNNSVLTAPLLPDSNSRAVALGAKFRTTFELAGESQAELVSGVTLERYRLNTTNLLQESSERQRVVLPVGANAKVPLAGSFLVAKGGALVQGVLYSSVQGPSTSESGSRSMALFSPRVSLESQVDPHLSLHATGGSYARAPTLYELYGTPVGISPNPNLQKEQAYRGDVGAQFEWRAPIPGIRSILFTYNAYLSHAKNLVTFVENAQNSQVAVNIGESVIQGHEFGAELRSDWDIAVRANANLMSTKNLSNIPFENGKQLPNRPTYRAHVSLGYDRPNFSAGYTLSVWGPSYWDVANLKQLSGVTDHGAFVAVSPKDWGTFVLEGRNLADEISASSQLGPESVVDNTSGYLGYPTPGRRLNFSWRMEL